MHLPGHEQHEAAMHQSIQHHTQPITVHHISFAERGGEKGPVHHSTSVLMSPVHPKPSIPVANSLSVGDRLRGFADRVRHMGRKSSSVASKVKTSPTAAKAANGYKKYDQFMKDLA